MSTPTEGLGNLQCHSLTLAKLGNAPGENDDALAYDRTEGLFAIADGATETVGADIWATILANGFVQAPISSAKEFDQFVIRLQPQWQVQVTRKTVPWYAEAKLAEGAFSTLLGLRLQTDGAWQAVAVGDSCLFQVRRGKLLVSFPVDNPQEFGNHPWLIGSCCIPGSKPLQKIGREASGQWQQGDFFCLMTDALAEWFLRVSLESGHVPVELVECLLQAARQSELEQAIDALQKCHGLRNDDATLMRIVL